jgi:hypothetical protein
VRGLDAAQLARRAVEQSKMSLLGLVRHLAEVERRWFRPRFAGQDVPNCYQSEDDPDGDFNGAVADQAIVNEAWLHMIEEYARHNGHADLLRERIGGRIGQ